MTTAEGIRVLICGGRLAAGSLPVRSIWRRRLMASGNAVAPFAVVIHGILDRRRCVRLQRVVLPVGHIR